MDVESAATFLVGSILICSGLIVSCLAIIFLNNIFAKFWKPVKFTILDPFKIPQNARFIDESELQPKTDIKTTANNKGELK
jgi:hypothetical protein